MIHSGLEQESGGKGLCFLWSRGPEEHGSSHRDGRAPVMAEARPPPVDDGTAGEGDKQMKRIADRLFLMLCGATPRDESSWAAKKKKESRRAATPRARGVNPIRVGEPTNNKRM